MKTKTSWLLLLVAVTPLAAKQFQFWNYSNTRILVQLGPADAYNRIGYIEPYSILEWNVEWVQESHPNLVIYDNSLTVLATWSDGFPYQVEDDERCTSLIYWPAAGGVLLSQEPWRSSAPRPWALNWTEFSGGLAVGLLLFGGWLVFRMFKRAGDEAAME